jgi:hypothetical protein
VTKRQAASDTALEQYRAEWRKSRKKLTLKKALAHCGDHHLSKPAWLHEAIYEFGLAQLVGMKKTGRQYDLLLDAQVYDTVESYLKRGFTLKRALREAGNDCLWEGDLNTPRSERRDRSFTVRSMWKRHPKRIVKNPPKHPLVRGGELAEAGVDYWVFKKKYQERDKTFIKDFIPAKDLPSYLRPKRHPRGTN